MVKPLNAEQKKSSQRKALLDFFTSELDLGKPARRIWLQEYSETQEVSTFDEIPSRSVVYVSTKAKPKERNMDNIHENLGRISDDLKLIEAFIATRKELTKKLYATPSIMRHGHPIEMKPRAKCMKARLEYEEKLKQKVCFQQGLSDRTSSNFSDSGGSLRCGQSAVQNLNSRS